MKVLVTCPPMLGMIESFGPQFASHGFDVTAPKIVQVMQEHELVQLLPQHDGWIIGDDPATRRVLAAGRAGALRAAVKWGVGVDNVDFAACRELGIAVENTPNMFGREVADIATGYVIGLARETFSIDRGVRLGDWPKPRGISLFGRTVALVGYGDIGKNTAQRLLALGLRVVVYDPVPSSGNDQQGVERAVWPERIEEADFIVLTCALTASSRHMLNKEVLDRAKMGVRVVNVGRGPVIDEVALEDALHEGKVFSAALDVFEVEPLPMDSYLRSHPRCVLGSHNASNTIDAVTRTSELAIAKLAQFLGAS